MRALSLFTAQPFRIPNARDKREKSGLTRRHITAIVAWSDRRGDL